MADIVAEGRGVPCVVLVGVEATQYVGPEVGVPQHLEENLRLILQQSLPYVGSSLVLSRPPSLVSQPFLLIHSTTARAVLRGTWYHGPSTCE